MRFVASIALGGIAWLALFHFAGLMTPAATFSANWFGVWAGGVCLYFAGILVKP